MKRRLFRRARAGIAILIALICAAALAATPASAALTHEFRNDIGGGKSAEPVGVAVNEATGNVYFADKATGEVRQFTPTGAAAEIGTTSSNTLGPFVFPAFGDQVAVDNSGKAKTGTIYVATTEGVRAFKANGEPAPFTAGGADAEGNLLKSFEGNSFEATAIAVDSEGDLYVGCVGNLTRVFSPDGEALAYSEGERVNGIAVAPSGRVYPSTGYVEPAVPGRVLLKVPEVYPPVKGTSYINALVEFSGSQGVAVDAGSEDVMIGGVGGVRQYEPTGAGAESNLALVTTFGETELAAGVRAVAVDGNDGDVYVSTGDHVVRYGPLVKAPNVVTGAATDVNSVADTATLNGTVDPLGEAVTACRFEYGLTVAYSHTAPCAETPTGNGPVPVDADISGLEAGNYHFRLVASGPEGTSVGADRIFAVATSPVVLSESAEAGSREARLSAQLEAGNGAATYYFQYGTSPAYGSTTASGSLPAAFAARGVSLAVAGLTPATTYYYRVVISNEVGTVYGAGGTFTTTLSGGIGGGCPNEALRVGYSALLPECRAYEMVSPVAKNGGEVYPIAGVQAAPSGEAVTFLSDTPFAGAPGNPLLNSYIATRGADGWTTTSPDPPARNTNSVLELSTVAFSGDLTETLQASTLALTPGAVEHGTNLYLRNNQTGHRQLVLAEKGENNFTLLTQGHTLYAGGSENGDRIIIRATIALNGEGVEGNGAVNIYEFANGMLSLVPGAEGAIRRPVSADGRRFFFFQKGALYVREADGRTVLISASQRPGPKFGLPEIANNPIASVDGSKVDFTAPEGLAVGAGTPESGVETLYIYDLETETLTQPIEGQVNAILSASADDSYVYFSSPAVLAEGGKAVENDATNFYVLHEGSGGSTIDYIATTSEGTGENLIVAGQASPNGIHFGFDSLSALTADDVPGPSCAEPSLTPTLCRQVFEYDFATKHLSCASCSPDPLGPSRLGGTANSPILSGYVPNSVVNSGLVFFETPSSLSPRDVNRAGDVYEWNGTAPQLISTGISEAESSFADVAGEGRDVFFKTTQPLVVQDVDKRTDLYDARVGGGIAAQNQAPASGSCEGEACRGASPLPPELKAATVSTCGHFALAATRAGKQARSLAKRAKKASGKHARQLRRRAVAARRQASHLKKQNSKCGRQGR